MSDTTQKRPNVIFILTDQQRLDSAGPLARGFTTPAMSGLADDGVCFRQCFTNAPQCIPARAALLSGKYPFESGIVSNADQRMPDKGENWFGRFRAGGYHTAVFGKTHLYPANGDTIKGEATLKAIGFETIDEVPGPREMANTRSHLTDRLQRLGLLDRYTADLRERDADDSRLVGISPLPLEHYYDTYVGERSRQFVESYDDPRPFFCWVGFPGPHEPYDAPEPYASMFDPAQMPAAVPRPEDLGGGADSTLRRLLKQRAAKPSLTAEQIGRLRANYAGNVRLIDDQIARLVATLRARELYDNTVILLSSDHGELNGDWNLLRKGNFLDPAVRVPLIVKPAHSGSPTVRTGHISDALIELIDIGPTLLDLAGLPEIASSRGRSFAPVVRGLAERHRQHVVSQLRGEQMYVNQKWKLILNGRGLPSFMFDRRNDPEERVNLL